jgi:hypothetical protein
VTTVTTTAIAGLLSACAATPMAPMAMPYTRAALPASVRVPAGHVVALETVAPGAVTPIGTAC